MNPIEEQRLMLDRLYRIISGSCPQNTETAKCRFDYHLSALRVPLPQNQLPMAPCVAAAG